MWPRILPKCLKSMAKPAKVGRTIVTKDLDFKTQTKPLPNKLATYVGKKDVGSIQSTPVYHKMSYIHQNIDNKQNKIHFSSLTNKFYFTGLSEHKLHKNLRYYNKRAFHCNKMHKMTKGLQKLKTKSTCRRTASPRTLTLPHNWHLKSFFPLWTIVTCLFKYIFTISKGFVTYLTFEVLSFMNISYMFFEGTISSKGFVT